MDEGNDLGKESLYHGAQGVTSEGRAVDMCIETGPGREGSLYGRKEWLRRESQRYEQRNNLRMKSFLYGRRECPKKEELVTWARR